MVDGLASKEAVAGCQVADIASTHYALHHNPNAVEDNKSLPVLGLDLVKLAFAALVMWGIDDATWDSMWAPARIFVTVLGCGAAVNNVQVGRAKP